ncbi:MAG TPA: hypothetical protein PKU88_02900 [Bacillota bacterium]|nr:hypothetical protein [Clostridiaceae bacterium]HNR03615.1 hypothetical protein [Bacillota bacterium]HNT02603.1 hypothetical protein [Bacillota bacterium]HPX68262.1 hypothetical protein [Bacillota bacterium]HQA65279.1 hypothetical protein [Bacillota bacterium]
MKNFFIKHKDKILSGQKVLKEYDIFEEIDTRLSDSYLFDRENNCVKLGYSRCKKIGFDNLLLYRFGTVSRDDETLIFVPQVDEQIGDFIKRSQVFLNNPVLPDETPVIHLNFDIHEKIEACIWLGNKYAYETYDMYLKGIIPWDNERKRSTEFKRTGIFIGTSSIHIIEYSGTEAEHKHMVFSTPNYGNEVDCYIDLKKGYFRLGQNGSKIYHSGLKQDESCSINVSCNSRDNQVFSCTNPGLILRRFELCRNQGVIYFKSIDASLAKESRVMMLYTGDIAVQYFNEKSNQWHFVKDSILFKDLHNVSLRAIMDTDDRIYALILLKVI